ncbi:MAG: apolipoprotein N-acyltransferase [Gammaproteobacteria bacterium]|nr:apolipoprotein N-acyltransferase [Gammaproteobacteria bacterium]
MRTALAVLAGGIHVLAFAPFYWWPLSIVSLSLLFYLWLDASPRGALFYGYVYGLAMFGFGVSWMYISLHTYGNMPAWAAVLSVGLGIAYISIFPALCGLLQGLLKGSDPWLRLCLVMPSIWIFLEWIRGWFLTGFPWLSMGYAYLETPLSNLAPLGGVYLVGLVSAMSAGVLAALVRLRSINSVFSAIGIAVLWGAGWVLNTTAWTLQEGDPIQVGIVQNNVSIQSKWDEAESQRIIEDYINASADLLEQDLIVWPEAAIPDYLDNLNANFWRFVEHHPADFVFGVLFREQSGDANLYYNSVASVTDRIHLYHKHHLVPFGEYFPAQWLFGPLLNMLDMPMASFTAGRANQYPLIAAGNSFAVSICYEDAFPNDGRFQIKRSGLMLNVSEDIWFGNSLAPHQRLQMARFRARESERVMIRASNTGLSSIINWKGGVDSHAPQFERAVLKGEVQPRSGITPYVAYGDVSVLVLVGTMLVIFILREFVILKQKLRQKERDA